MLTTRELTVKSATISDHGISDEQRQKKDHRDPYREGMSTIILPAVHEYWSHHSPVPNLRASVFK